MSNTERPAEGQQVAVPEKKPSQQLARLAAPRLPYHPIIEQAFGIDKASWKALCESVFPMAKTTDAVCLALAYCKARKLDIMKKPVHIVPMWNSELKKEVETVWPAITEHRITAHRTGQYAGTDKTEFGPSITKHFEAKVSQGKNAGKIYKADVTFHEWAEVTVYRLVQGQKMAFPGPRVYYEEFFGMTAGLPVPNARWARSPSQMLEKCAEAGALRKAFTEEIGNEPIAEEMEDRIIQQVTTAMNKKRPQQRALDAAFTAENEVIDETEAEEAEEEEVDQETGEILDATSGGAADPKKDEAKPDRGLEWLAQMIASIKGADRALLAQKDKAARDVIANEERPDLLPKWEEAVKARAVELDAAAPKEEVKPEPETQKAQPAAAEKAPEVLDANAQARQAVDDAYSDWKAEQYATLGRAKMTRTVDDLQDMVLPDLHEADKADWIAACNAKAKELLRK